MFSVAYSTSSQLKMTSVDSQLVNLPPEEQTPPSIATKDGWPASIFFRTYHYDNLFFQGSPPADSQILILKNFLLTLGCTPLHTSYLPPARSNSIL